MPPFYRVLPSFHKGMVFYFFFFVFLFFVWWAFRVWDADDVYWKGNPVTAGGRVEKMVEEESA